MGARLSILKAAFDERLRFDLGPANRPAALGMYAAASALTRSSSPDRKARGFGLLMKLHAAALSQSVDRRIVDRLRDATVAEQQGHFTGLWACYADTIRTAVSQFPYSPARYIGTRILVVKTARPNERGVIVVDYSNVFPLLVGMFDLQAITDRYTLVLEPSWNGLCQPELLLFTQYRCPIVVQTAEPRDQDMIAQLKSNLSFVPLAANWWTDPRQAPPADAPRDIDVIMVASWADWKRHWRLFKALAQLRKRGHRLKTVLVGYEMGRTRGDIEALAEYFGIRDQVETFERISQDEVWKLLTRSKVHVLWSRREGSNRAIIEAMLADVPVIVRDGLNFGFRYPHVNEQTGRFVQEHELGDTILEMIAARRSYSPRDWMVRHMTCQKATQILEEHLRAAAQAAGEPWSGGLVVKTSALDAQQYLDPADRGRFVGDYQFLKSALRRRPAQTVVPN
jgi:glycosyltransferase involved in cell wall biosynthesis